jgi:hypothetical protein
VVNPGDLAPSLLLWVSDTISARDDSQSTLGMWKEAKFRKRERSTLTLFPQTSRLPRGKLF